jgi:hypothetical protein
VAFLRYRSRPNSAAFVLTKEDYTSGVDIVMELMEFDGIITHTTGLSSV